MKIWCLFSILNEYDQPDNNLVAWWATKPTFDVLAQALDFASSEPNERVWRVLKGQEVSIIGGCDYRLICIGEGVLK